MKYKSRMLFEAIAAMTLIIGIQFIGAQPARAADHFSHVAFAAPMGWARAEAGGWLQFTPPGVPPGETVAIQISPGGASSRELGEEFGALIKVSANALKIVEQGTAKSSTDRQGLKTISQSVVFQDAAGKSMMRYFVARRNGGRFESVVYTASTPELAKRYASVMNTFLGGMVFDGAPTPTAQRQPPNAQYPPAPKGDHPSPNAQYPPAPNAQRQAPIAQRQSQNAQLASASVHLSPMAARPMSVTGRAVFENGQPIPKFKVTMAGMSGKFDPLFNNHLGGPQARETATAHGGTDGVNGQYAIHSTEDATITGVYAMVHLHFDNMNWGLPAWPTDNISDGSGTATNDDFRGHLSKGIVRDFVLKMSGLKPGYDPAKSPDHHRNGDTFTVNGYYGGSILFDCGSDSTPAAYKGGVSGMMASRGGITKVYPAGSIVTVTLTPIGSRADGLPAQTITRTCRSDVNFMLFGIPYALYTATATLAEPRGAVHKLQLSASIPLSVESWSSSAPIRWIPMQAVDSVIIPVTIWLAE